MGAELYYDRYQDSARRFTLVADLTKAPALNAVIGLPGSDSTSPTATALAAYTIANRDFELLGTNEVTGDTLMDTTGGVKLATHGGSTDSAIMLPHLDTNQTAWTKTLWDTAKSLQFRSVIKSGTVITLATYWIGFKLTNTPTIATDDDQAFFTYSSAAPNSGAWVYNYSIAGTDYAYTVPTSICPLVAASTVYDLRIEINADRTHMAYINEKAIAANPFPALTSLTTLIPYHGVVSLTDAVAKNFTIKHLACSRLH